MDPDEFREILAAAGIDSEPAGPEFLAWLAANKCPAALIDLYRGSIPKVGRRRAFADRWCLFTGKEILEEAGEFPRYLKAGLLSVGACPNGDPIAVDIRKRIGEVGYISHDDVWGDDEARIRKYFAAVAPSLLDFARRATRREVPLDYHAAIRGR